MSKKVHVLMLLLFSLSVTRTYCLEFLDTIDYDFALSPDTIYRNGSHKKGYITRTLASGEPIQLFYGLQGTGEKTLVFIHDFPFSSAQWDNQVKELSKDYRVLTLDLRGMGSSSKICVECFEDYLDDIHHVLLELSIDSCILVGHGTGGLLALAYTAQYPETIAKLVLINATLEFVSSKIKQWGITPELKQEFLSLLSSKKEINFEEFATQWSDLAFNEPRDLGDVKYTYSHMTVSNEPEMLAHFAEHVAKISVTNLLAKIEVPTLIFIGGIDALIPPGTGYYISAQLAKSRVFLFPKGGHMAHLTHPNVFNKVLKNFISGTFKQKQSN